MKTVFLLQPALGFFCYLLLLLLLLLLLRLVRHELIYSGSEIIKIFLPLWIEVREFLLSFGAEFLSFSLLYKNIKIKINRTAILPVFCMGVKLDLSH
jgi:hypothetical protein